MFRLAVVCLFAVVAAQRYTDDPRSAAILSEQRYLSGDGTFGAAYTQEDGVDFKEESDAAGNRRGSYSYVDPSGQRRTVSYTAGKNGFVATGDHLPVAPAAPQAPAPAPAQSARYNQAPQQFSAPRGNPSEDDGQYYPELYEREDNSIRQQYAAPQQQQQQYSAPQQQQYSTPQQQQYSAPRAQPQYSGVQQQQQQYSAPQQPQYSGPKAAPASRPQQYFAPEATTQQPARFFPPGKLDLNRSPDGYSYSFSSKF